MVISSRSCAETANKFTEKRDSRAELLFCWLNRLLFDVFVAVAIVVSYKVPNGYQKTKEPFPIVHVPKPTRIHFTFIVFFFSLEFSNHNELWTTRTVLAEDKNLKTLRHYKKVSHFWRGWLPNDGIIKKGCERHPDFYNTIPINQQ